MRLCFTSSVIFKVKKPHWRFKYSDMKEMNIWQYLRCIIIDAMNSISNCFNILLKFSNIMWFNAASLLASISSRSAKKSQLKKARRKKKQFRAKKAKNVPILWLFFVWLFKVDFFSYRVTICVMIIFNNAYTSWICCPYANILNYAIAINFENYDLFSIIIFFLSVLESLHTIKWTFYIKLII